MSLVSKKTVGRKSLFDGAMRELRAVPIGFSTESPAVDSSSVVLKGFSLEVLNFGYSISIQDSLGQLVRGARVFVTDLGDYREVGVTDKRGCFYGNAEEGVTYVITIIKEGYVNYTHRFRIISQSMLLFPAKNFPLLVYNLSDTPVAAAQVVITSPGHSDSGLTDAAGLFQGVAMASNVNSITVSKVGFTNYSQQVNPFLKINCSESSLVAVPVILLS
jgi:hypothetical protein